MMRFSFLVADPLACPFAWPLADPLADPLEEPVAYPLAEPLACPLLLISFVGEPTAIVESEGEGEAVRPARRVERRLEGVSTNPSGSSGFLDWY